MTPEGPRQWKSGDIAPSAAYLNALELVAFEASKVIDDCYCQEGCLPEAAGLMNPCPRCERLREALDAIDEAQPRRPGSAA